MAIQNFIEFATNRIRPDVFQEYLDGPFQQGDFSGKDESTLDFTKLGWLMSVRSDMNKKGTVTAEIDQLVADIFVMLSSEDSGAILNHHTLSNGNYNILQQLVFDNRANKDYDLFADNDYISGFQAAVEDLLYSVSDTSQMSAAEMIVEYGLNESVSAFDVERLGSNSTDAVASRRFCIQMQAIRKRASERLTQEEGAPEGNAAKVYNVISQKLTDSPPTSYNAYFYKNPTSQTSAIPKNEVSRLVTFLSQDLLKQEIEDVMATVPADGEVNIIASAIQSSVGNATGLSSSQVNFDASRYKSETSSLEANQGYSPLFYYISRYRGTCKKDILDAMAVKFSPLAITISDEANDGFTPLGLLAHYLEIIDGEWSNPEAVEFISSAVAPFAGLSSVYKRMSALGSARDFTGGATSNAFGVVNNILLKINSQHSAWWEAEQADDASTATVSDFESTYNTLVDAVLGGLGITYSVYGTWMHEFGKEIE